MNSKKHILKRIAVLVIFTTLLAGSYMYNSLAPSVIYVFAGNDTYTCVNQSLQISSLNATITGDVTDGDWITLGDGRFLPGNVSTIRYSQAVTYLPGTNDKILGSYKLMLISDAPVNNPQAKVIDDVNISFQNAPPLICTNNLNISLNENCIQKVDVTMLQPNPQIPYSNYIITLTDSSGTIIPDNILTRVHIDKEISFKIGHQCTNNYCWGKFKVEDYFPPVLICRNDTILCTKSFEPDSLGFPFPISAYIDTIINGKYIVKNWDACSDVILEFKDILVKANCLRDEDKTISRKWKATDAKGNVSTCEELIVVKRMSLSGVVFPPHYDGTQKPAFECSDTFPKLPNGYPSPDTTGYPFVGHCLNLQYNMSDIKFDLCGKSYKIVRSWFVIDWCTSESMTRNQIILIKDNKGPKLICQDSIVIVASPYVCATENVPAIMPLSISDCSDYSVALHLTSTLGMPSDQFLKKINNTYHLSGLPVGHYFINYIATDLCNNSSTCKTLVKIIDQSVPYPVCDQTTKTALDANGKARIFAGTFDDGSSDNCGISGFRVRKMTDICGFGTQFGDYVDFCCAELGSTIMVALEVTDIHGLKNTCMVEVIVEDKIKPSITCPPNITLECTNSYDFNHLDEFGTVVTDPGQVRDINIHNYYHHGKVGIDGLASDNCGVTVSESYISNISCHTGTIIRKFIATDHFGRKDSCSQTITILNPFPFTGNDIMWPEHYYGNGCKSSQIHPDVTGKPIFKNTSCSTVAATYEDNAFYIADGACLKIIRSWTVVDWCQFTGTNNYGKWGPYIQIIKLHNTDRPYFTSTCKDTIFCSFDSDCNVGFVQLNQTAKDSCTDDSQLIWEFALDLFNDGTNDSVGYSAEFHGDLPIGQHLIKWSVADQCGNGNNCVQTFSITDCKKPSPYCITSLTLSLDQISGKVSIWAKDFDLGSFDNCIDSSGLLFTFDGAVPVDSLINIRHFFTGKGVLSTETNYNMGLAQIWIPESNTSGLQFDCTHIPNGINATIQLDMTVTDVSGNQDFCKVELVLQDNTNHCEDLITHGSITGNIITTNNKAVAGTRIECIRVPESQQEHMVINDVNGNYIIDSLNLNADYLVKPTLNSAPLEGVSTIDLVMIQRHILGYSPFNNPYKLLAADVNGSKSVTASDLVDLRKLILGITNSFPKNRDSWIFVPKEFVFQDTLVPYDHDQTISVYNLSGLNTGNDFKGVKLGDVNESALGIVDQNEVVKNRNSHSFDIVIREENIEGEDVLTFRAGQDIKIDGLQLFLEAPELYSLTVDFKAKTNLFNNGFESFQDNDSYRFLGYSSNQVHLRENDLIAWYKLNKKGTNLKSITLDHFATSEIYSGNNVLPIRLRPGIFEDKLIQSYFSLVNNPITSELRFKSNKRIENATFQITILNSTGTVMLNQNWQTTTEDENEYNMTVPDDMIPGVYFIQFAMGHKVETLKFIKIR
ncbi:MAG: T9SS type A sorting domain-containing protein [Saprospiraceae bacterium]|nr:T9SS type A sorting domain-containing protein [Saprospiraceae bacterium]